MIVSTSHRVCTMKNIDFTDFFNVFLSGATIIVAVYDVLEIYSDPGKMYYTFEVYQAFNERGQYMKFSFKKFYKDKDRTKFVTSVQSSVETGTRFSDVENPNTVS